MAQNEIIQLFDNLKVRVLWDDEQEKVLSVMKKLLALYQVY